MATRTSWDNFSSSDKLRSENQRELLCGDPKCIASGAFVDYLVLHEAP